jgi:GNAT superfamily N-acetyltransferase
MFNERQPAQEFAAQPEQVLAQHFVQGRILESAQVVYEGDRSTIYRCLEENEVIPEIDNSRFHIDYRNYKQAEEHRPDQLRFEYEQLNDQGDNDRLIAEMHLAILDSNHFNLEHRYVAEDLRGTGIGTRLLQRVESWLKYVAQDTAQEVVMSLKTGQAGVISWLEKNGFSVKKEQEDLLNSFKQHPEEFVVEDVKDKDGLVKQQFIFKKETSGRSFEDAIRLQFDKVITG